MEDKATSGTCVRLSAAPRPSGSETCTLQREDSAQDGGVLAGVRRAPGEATPEDTWALINEKTASLATNHKLNIPDLKVGVAGRRLQRKNCHTSSPPVVVSELMGYDILVASSMIIYSPLNRALPSLCLEPDL